jgi:hypothetical protein
MLLSLCRSSKLKDWSGLYVDRSIRVRHTQYALGCYDEYIYIHLVYAAVMHE